MSEAKRRVRVGRPAAEKPIDIDVQAYVDRQIEGLNVEELRQIIIRQEVQMNSVRMILFDMASVFASQYAKRGQALTKTRFGTFTRQLMDTFRENLTDLRAAHIAIHDEGGVEDVNDLWISPEEQEAVAGAIGGMPSQEAWDAAAALTEDPERSMRITERILEAIRAEAQEHAQGVDLSDIPTQDYIEETDDAEDLVEQLAAETEELDQEMEVRRRRATRARTSRPPRRRGPV